MNRQNPWLFEMPSVQVPDANLEYDPLFPNPQVQMDEAFRWFLKQVDRSNWWCIRGADILPASKMPALRLIFNFAHHLHQSTIHSNATNQSQPKDKL